MLLLASLSIKKLSPSCAMLPSCLRLSGNIAQLCGTNQYLYNTRQHDYELTIT